MYRLPGLVTHLLAKLPMEFAVCQTFFFVPVEIDNIMKHNGKKIE